MRRLPMTLAVACSLAAAGLAAAPGQDPPQPRATFKSSVDLVPVDVGIVDKTGRPVTGLEAHDFVLTVDGTPRRIVSAEYIRAGRDVEEPSPTPAHYSTNAAAAGGRLIMIVVDQGNIGSGRGRAALEAASHFISQLSPADRVAVVAIPGLGPQIDFTSNHALVQTLLPKLVGQDASFQGPMRIGITEAIQIKRGDPGVLQEVLERECTGVIREAADVEVCHALLKTEASSLFLRTQDRTRNSLLALRYLMERLALTPSPKTIVLLSEGLFIHRDLEQLAWVAPASSRGQTALYVLQLSQPVFESAEARVCTTRSEDLSLGEEGLGFLAGRARGTVLRVVTSAQPAFARLRLELSGYYLLSFEPDARDRDGRAHKIKLEVPGRRGVEIRARAEFTVDTAPKKADAAVLAETLRTPLLASEIGLRISTYTLRDSASEKLRLLIAADIDRSLNSAGKIAVGYALVDSKGKVVASHMEPDVTAPVRALTKIQTFVGSVLAEASGVYMLKLAVVDDRGQRGSVEHTFRAQLASAGQVRVTDLVIAEESGTAADGPVPAVTGEFVADVLHGYVELYSDAVEVLKNTTVVVEVAANEQSRALDAAAAEVRPPTSEAPNRRTAEGSVPIALLPPGNYVARAVISINGRRAGQVARPFTIGKAMRTKTAPAEFGRAAKAAGASIPFKSSIDAFERSSVLTPQVVGFFLDRMNVGGRGATAARPAIDHARSGRFDAALEALKSAGNDQLAAAFFGGLALYARGDLESAAGKFRESLRIDSEFFPAVFYLGSCYAAGGQDREAVGAWRTALVTESDAPFVYTLLADAFLRLGDLDQALDILKEASTLWPDNDQVQPRFGTALARSGKRIDAVQVLEPYLAKHAEDEAAHFVMLRTIYEAHAAGTAIKSTDEDKALFAKYAAAYAAANGPQRVLVDQWKKFIDRK